jgi:hypothetical protein
MRYSILHLLLAIQFLDLLYRDHPANINTQPKMRAASVVALLLAALCVASAARIPEDDPSNIKETISSIGSVQVGADDLRFAMLLLQLYNLRRSCALAAGYNCTNAGKTLQFICSS